MATPQEQEMERKIKSMQRELDELREWRESFDADSTIQQARRAQQKISEPDCGPKKVVSQSFKTHFQRDPITGELVVQSHEKVGGPIFTDAPYGPAYIAPPQVFEPKPAAWFEDLNRKLMEMEQKAFSLGSALTSKEGSGNVS